MKRTALTLLTLGLVASSTYAQEVKASAVVELWYTQMLSDNLRQNTAAGKYYQLNSAFTENGFSLKRCELYLTGKLSEDISYNVMFDPNTTTSASSPTALADAYITYKASPWLSFRAGQFKPFQTFEASMVSSSEILFYDRSQMAKLFGDKRDRGLVATATWGKTDGLWGKINLGVINGTTDKDAGKANDANAQKDLVSRFEFGLGKIHKFGFYTRYGRTDAAENKGAVGVNPFDYNGPRNEAQIGKPSPTSDEIRDNKDKTTNYGVYYALESKGWIAQVEAITGKLGRRYPSLGIAKPDATVAVPNPATPSASREYIGQNYFGLVLTGGYRVGAHTFLLRYDFLDYNKGSEYYGPYNPYTTRTAYSFDRTTQTWIVNPAAGTPLGADYTPRFTEIVAGWNYSFLPTKWSSAHFKLNYIHRSKNFLQPRPGQTGEQGGDSLVAALKVAF
jgi:phosphate-selective porin